MSDLTSHPDDILAKMNWVRGLAQRMVQDPHLAEDLAQDALVAELELRSPPSSPRAWTSSVLKNLRIVDIRRRERRTRREALAATSPLDESSVPDTVERLSMLRDLVDEVFSLEEPYRSAIIERYFEEKTPKELARRDGIPLATVKTRLARGLRQLRERLDARHGSSWALAWLGRPEGWAPPSFSGPSASGLLTLGVSVATLIFLGTLSVRWFFFSDPPPPHLDRVAQEQPLSDRDESFSDVSLDPGSGEFEVAARPPLDHDLQRRPILSSEPGDPDPSTRPRTVGVVDVAGARMKNFRVVVVDQLTEETMDAQSDARGLVTLPSWESVFVRSGEDNFVAIFEGWLNGSEAAYKSDLVVIETGSLIGRIFDEQGNPISDVRLAASVPGGMLDAALESTRTVDRAHSDSEGRFEVKKTPLQALRGTLEVSKPGYQTQQLYLSDLPRDGVEIVLRRTDGSEVARQYTVKGWVVDEGESPVHEAAVYLLRNASSDKETMHHTLTEKDGSFSFQVPGGMMAELVSVDPETLCVATQIVDEHDDRPIVLTYRAPELVEVEGVVIDTLGLPIEGVVLQAAVPCSLEGEHKPSLVEPLVPVETTTSDEDGGFLVALPKGVHIHYIPVGERIAPVMLCMEELREEQGEGPLELRLMRWARFRVHWMEGTAADSFELLDTNGEMVAIYTVTQLLGSQHRISRDLLTSPATVYWTTDNAVTLVLYSNGKLIESRPIRWEEDEIPVLRF